MTITLSPRARQDLQEAYQYVSQDNIEAADRLLGRITEVLGLLASGTLDGREVRLRDGRVVRTWYVAPYRLFYRRTKDSLQVVRLYHHARRPLHR